MAGTLGELVVSITTDLTNLNAGLKQADENIRNTSAKINEYTNKIGLTLTAAGTAITGAFALMVKSTVDYGDQIYETSQRTGVAVETLSRLKYVADQTESSFEAVTSGVKNLNKNIYDAINGNKAMNDNFVDLGITLKNDVTGQALKADEVLLKVADRFSVMTDNTAKTNIALQIFGRSGESLIPILNLGSDGIRRLSEEADQLNITLTEKNAKDIDNFSDIIKTFKVAMGGLSLEITNTLLPALTSFVKWSTEIVIKMREWTSEHPALTKAVGGLGLALLGLGAGVLIINQLNKAYQTLLALATAMQLVNVFSTFRLGGLVTDIGILVRNVGLLYPAVVLIGTAFASWKIGRFLSEITGLDNALSGENGILTKMYGWFYKNEQKAASILRTVTAIATFGFSEAAGIGRRIAGGSVPAESATVSPGSIALSVSGEETKKQVENIDNTIKAIEKYNEAVKTLNNEYLSGRITAEQYFTQSTKLHTEGIAIRQQELEILQKAVELSDLKSTSELQGLQIAKEKIETELSLAQQSIDLGALANDVEYQKLSIMDQSMQKAKEYYQVKAQLANQDMIDQQTTLDSATSLLQTMQSMHKTVWGSVFDFMNMGIKTFSSGFSTAISSIILGTKSASEAFKDFGKMMITAVVEFIVQYAVQAAISMALGAAIAAFVGTIAGGIAEAWLPAAFLASVATFGGAVGAGTAALGVGAGAATGLLTGMQAASKAAGSGIKGYAEGGIAGLHGPEIALFGEKEPELITPLSKLGNLGNTINIEINNPVIREEQDIDNLANEISRRIARGTSR